ncbi:MAG TPA: glutamine-hydrolyzing carbamoyl-phosphate synthase small subunit [Oligoflexia bacterium]|nr:glutamine-hydrolyzing carbamoyl-phosphate synthase small subunit [Oligoflexia bacterium]HMP47542.1 glutamine-hydrolyzing carbamoyl-phosphate synthase small subunit [Oligoflexia bacterium]
MKEKATLALADGTIFRGISCGSEGSSRGEVVFNTSMSGYQEILTDPSYSGQMITFTYPHIGNVGVNDEDIESDRIHATGLIVRDICEVPSNYRSKGTLPDYLKEAGIVGISGIDTRALVLHLRDNGSQMGIIRTGEVSESDLVDEAKSLPSMEGMDLVPLVSCKAPYEWNEGVWQWNFSENSSENNRNSKGSFKIYSRNELSNCPHVVAIDFGVKYNILRLLTESGFRVTVVPASTSSEQILSLKPDALFLSNGPGDPAAVTYGIETTKNLLGKMPIFGICLGHQILGLSLGAPTFKLKFGHRGGNHPVRNEKTGVVEISVQNHGFATDASRIPKGVCLTHVNLNDNTVEGLEVPDLKAFSVQYHPECSPGPHDSSYLFKDFFNLVTN